MTATATLERARRSSRAGAAIGRLFGQPLAAAGLVVVAAFVLLALAAPILPLPDPDVGAEIDRLKPPLSGFGLLGTDHLGRDVASRLVWGLRVSLGVGAAATLAATLIGSAIGLVAAYYGRLADMALMRAIDVLMAFPYLLLALAVVAALGPGLTNAAIAIAVANVPFFARATRGAALGVVGRDYVDAARMAGLSDLRILLSEVLPNVAPLIVVSAATTIGWMILETAGLSFLGLGAQPPQSDLGSMLADGRKALASAPHVAAAPGLAIFALAVGLNLLGDGLRDLLDPRMEAGKGGAPAPATQVERTALLPAARGESARSKAKVGWGHRAWSGAVHPEARPTLTLPCARGGRTETALFSASAVSSRRSPRLPAPIPPSATSPSRSRAADRSGSWANPARASPSRRCR